MWGESFHWFYGFLKDDQTGNEAVKMPRRLFPATRVPNSRIPRTCSREGQQIVFLFYENVLKELEQKKPQLEELVSTAESLKSHANRQQLHGKVCRLREHWEETRARVESRKRELNEMLTVCRRWDAVRRDATAWVDAMERRLQQLGPVAHSLDALDAQLKDQKGFHGELHQHRPKLDQLNQLSQSLVESYPQDDTRYVKKVTEQLNHRYGVLNSSAVNRGKSLHAAVSSLHSWDKTVDKFLAWLSEAQSTLTCVENDPDATRANAQFKTLYVFRME
ncbi:unnamed protein product [Notodromas monacha]|uniref:Dystrophin n=1 Tax=Notodromas monacha TaxID=399045 RepID=A0A7R9BU40_9CRUS|nr:unnamed protein product [Notodromas monacha]CAG0921447.1 unnamed protein product [Notodromas monacha]